MRTNDTRQDPLPELRIGVCPSTEDPPRYLPDDSRTISWVRSQTPGFARFVWLILLAGSVGLIATGWHLKPDPRGLGTHEQLGFSPCGFYLSTGLPCPTCGATTAYAWVIHGHLWMGLKAQPFGAIVAVASAALLGMSLVGIVTAGVPAIRLSRRSSFGLALAIMMLILGSWLYKLIQTMIAR